MERDFDEILKQMSYEEWRKRKIQKRHELLTDPQAAIWNYVDEQGNLYATDKDYSGFTSTDEILRQIEKHQNVYHITLKRRAKVPKNSDEWYTFTEKIESINHKITLLNHKLNMIHWGQGEE